MSGSFVPVHVDHWQGGAVVSASEFRAAALWPCSDQPIFTQQVPGRGMPSCKTRSGTTASQTWSVLVLLHTGLLHSFAACLVGGHQGGDPKAEHFVRTYHRRLDLLDGKLKVSFLNGFLPNAVSLLFGELFTTVLYDGVAVDPGSPKMRGSLERHLRQIKPKITKVVATHAHEEHVGNLNWLSDLTGAPIYVSEMTARFLTPFKKLPWVRATIIGQPPNLKEPHQLLRGLLETDSGQLQVIPTPGHCDDHVVLYEPKEKLLLAGDAFMGSYFGHRIPTWTAANGWIVLNA